MPFTVNIPKSLVLVGDKPILYYQLLALKLQGINKLTMVIGYHGNKLRKYIEEDFPDLEVNFIENNKYMQYGGDAYSAYLARNEYGIKCLQINSDILFHPQVLKEVLTLGKSSIFLKRKPCQDDDMKVYIKGDKVTGLSKVISSKEAVGESMGIYYFEGNFLKSFKKELEASFAQKGFSPEMNKSHIIEKLIARGDSLYYVDVTQYPIIEINDPEDLEKAQTEIFPQIKFI